MSEVYCIVRRTAVLSEPTAKVRLQQPLAYNNGLAHSMQAVLYDEDGSEADLSGVGVVASFMKANDETVEPINGTTSGNVAEVILPVSCYVTPGRFKFTMNLMKTGGYARTILWVEGVVERNTTTTIIDPGTEIPNVTQAIGEALAAAESANTAAEAAAALVEELEDYEIASVAEVEEYLDI